MQLFVSCKTSTLLNFINVGHLFISISILKGDVYPVEPYEEFAVNQVLDAHWGVLYDEDVSILFM